MEIKQKLIIFFLTLIIFFSLGYLKALASVGMQCLPSCVISPGQSVTLRSFWNYDTRCIGKNPVQFDTWTWFASGWADLAGENSEVVSPSVTSTYYARCESADSTTQNEIWSHASITVVVAPPPPPAPTASCSVSPNPVPYNGNPGITLSSTNGYYCYVYNDWYNVSTGYFTSGTYYPGAQTVVGAHQGEVYCYNTVWVGSGWNYCNYTVSPPSPPIAPTISGATSGYISTPYTYTFNSTDPNGYQIRYGIDWSEPADGVADEWLPSGVTYVNSGVSQSTNHSWSSTGVKTFKALAQNTQGTNSAWSNSYSVTISNIPVTGTCGSANKVYPIGSTSYGGDTFCSAGTLGGALSATGGNVTTSGNYTVHTFASNGTFIVNSPGTIEYLVVAGGGGGGAVGGSGGGAGGVRHGSFTISSANSFAVVVGGSGTGSWPGCSGGSCEHPNGGFSGGNSSFIGPGITVSSTGGGGGTGYYGGSVFSGGSGSGGSIYGGPGGTGISGEGNNGGYSDSYFPGGGGGANAVGGNGSGIINGSGRGGAGGSGYTWVNGSSYGGGGGGGVNWNSPGTGGLGGVGGGGNGGSSAGISGGDASYYGGGGGGGSNYYGGGGNGYQGIVIVRYLTNHSPAFPAPGTSVNWSCLGVYGGGNASCSATLTQTTHTVTVTRTVGGRVTSADGIINCGSGSGCYYDYDQGSNITLKALPNSSYWKFTGWTGDCSGTGQCVLSSIMAPKSVHATFGLRLFKYSEF